MNVGSGKPLRIDVHCHVGLHALPCQHQDRFSFEPPGQYAPYDAYFSPRLQRTIGMKLARWIFELKGPDDTALEKILLDQILGANEIDRAVVLAFDQHHTTDGKALGPRQSKRVFGTDLYVSNTYVRQLAQRYPEPILFGASIHPYRPGAPAMLDEVAAAGAVLIKWLPVTQNIDAGDERAVAFMRHAAQIGMPLLIHYGGEMSLGNMHPEQEDPSPLLASLRKLREEGTIPTVIVAHCATPAKWPFASGRYFKIMTDALLGEFAHAPLYVDTSALSLFSRARYLKRLLAMPQIHHKLVYGSDFPILPTALSFRHRLGDRYRPISKTHNKIDKDVRIKRALGFPPDHFTRGWDLIRRA
jgi:predicted TIM-barrel fold metal-dependent hydrolase